MAHLNSAPPEQSIRRPRRRLAARLSRHNLPGLQVSTGAARDGAAAFFYLKFFYFEANHLSTSSRTKMCFHPRVCS